VAAGHAPASPAKESADALIALAEEVTACTACPRLTAYRQEVARRPPARYRSETYWARPLPGFGDPMARLLLVGLAPAAHGGNRTGRMFTGDGSADFLVSALFRHGFANQPTSTHRHDGLRLWDAYMTAVVRCAPPDNRPLPEEVRQCRRFLLRERSLLPRVRVVVCLGKVAWDGYLAARRDMGCAPVRASFAHGAEVQLPEGVLLLASYHPSRQNTQTRRLTPAMMDAVLLRARRALEEGP
jgi:uracil-DNA glycosylase family 4